MGSSRKTKLLNLNNWSATDTPKMSDFNYDNELIDMAFKEHIESDAHVSEEDREKWDSPFYVGFYYGNGNQSRTISTSCPFEPSFGIIFAGGMPPSVTDFSNKLKYNYVGFLSSRCTTLGLSLSNRNIVFSTNGGPSVSGEYISLNNVGITYCYVFFR